MKSNVSHLWGESIYINYLSSAWNIPLPLHLFIFYLHQNELMSVYFIIWVITQCYFIFLCKFSRFSYWEPSVSSCIPLTYTHLRGGDGKDVITAWTQAIRSSSPLSYPWNVPSAHHSHSWSHFKNPALRGNTHKVILWSHHHADTKTRQRHYQKIKL